MRPSPKNAQFVVPHEKPRSVSIGFRALRDLVTGLPLLMVLDSFSCPGPEMKMPTVSG
jgi:hypothetical protein